MPTRARAIETRLRDCANPATAAHSARFFRALPGGYGEGDRFLGIRVPTLRTLARELSHESPTTAFALLRSPWHEARLLALLMLVALFARAADSERRALYGRYLAAVPRYVNNWDLVDTSAPAIVGGYLEGRSCAPLFALARSRNLWNRRVAVLATLRFIKARRYAPTLELAELLLDDEHDLVHKAVGWMLREVGKRRRATLEGFLDRHHARMPRTMLRYAIEKLPAPTRRRYLART